jgi:excisionase family DNA binding protein
MTDTVIVHHPVPMELDHLLAVAGYRRESTTEVCSVFVKGSNIAQASERDRHNQYELKSTVNGARSSAAVSPELPCGEAIGSFPEVGRVEEVATVLRCSKWCVYDLIGSGALKSIRLGRAIRVTRRALEDFLSE